MMHRCILFILMIAFFASGISGYAQDQPAISIDHKTIQEDFFIIKMAIESQSDSIACKDAKNDALLSSQKIMVTGSPDLAELLSTEILFIHLGTKYISSQNWKIKLIGKVENYPAGYYVNDGQLDCQKVISGKTLPVKIKKKTIDGQTYWIESFMEGAAGTIYVDYTYSTLYRHIFVRVNCVIRYPQCHNYSEPLKTECFQEEETFDLGQIIGRIIRKLFDDELNQ